MDLILACFIIFVQEEDYETYTNMLQSMVRESKSSSTQTPQLPTILNAQLRENVCI